MSSAENTKTTDFLLGIDPGRRLRPLIRKLHPIPRDIFGLEEFPVKVLLLAFQGVFTQLDRFFWREELKDTNIFIRDKYPEKQNEDELKPAIITDRGPISPMNVNGRGRQQEVDLKRGILTFGDLMACPMTIHCLSKSGIEAGQIASAVMGVLLQDEDVFKSWGVHALVAHQLGQEGEFLVDSELTLMDVPVSVTMQFAWSWSREVDGKRFLDSHLELEDC